MNILKEIRTNINFVKADTLKGSYDPHPYVVYSTQTIK